MAEQRGNFIGEWFGYRTYPNVRLDATALDTQRAEHCPFLTASIGAPSSCIKAVNSRGVCTINTLQNQERADWLVCPIRALDASLITASIETLFSCPRAAQHAVPGIGLELAANRVSIIDALATGKRCFIYFNAKLGGELSIGPTKDSPEFSFDVTVIEIVSVDGTPTVGRFGVIEIQTMDFHGSYMHAVKNLKDGLRLHPADFPSVLLANQRWLSDRVEGPNIANVFKRTFYQLAFKFEVGETPRSAGCVLALPRAVWTSWQPHLGAPQLEALPDGTFALLAPGAMRPAHFPGWIFVLDIDDEGGSPAPLSVAQRIGTNVPALVHYALGVAPKNAIAHMQSNRGLYAFLRERIRRRWPELATTIVDDADEV
jgi:hypothetical protein